MYTTLQLSVSIKITLTYTLFLANLADDKLMIFPTKTGFDTMQIISFGANLFERSKAIFFEKQEKYFKMSSSVFFFLPSI